MSMLTNRPRLTAQLISSVIQQDQIQKVYKVNVTSLNITKIQGSIKKYNRLRCLILDFNFIQKIENINSLFDLRQLHIEGNLLTKIEGLQTSKNLTVLNLASNKIQKIQNISHLGRLEMLNLSKNNLCKITQLESLKQLKVLNLSHNSIVSLDSLPAFSKVFLNLSLQLQTLLLNNNKIQSISQQKFSNSSKVIRVDLSHNQLSQCRFISRLTNVESLNISHNRLIKFETETPLKLLQQLNLQNNQLENLQSIGAYFPELVVLNITNNMFCSQHQFITMISETQMITEIQFIDNPITTKNFQSTLYKLFQFDRINKKSFNEPGAKYLTQINTIQRTFTHEFADIEDDQDDRKIRMSGFYNDDLQCKMTGIKPHRAMSPSTKKAKLLVGNDYNQIARNFSEFLQNDKKIKALRQKYQSICLENNIAKPKIQPLQQDSNIYLTQGETSNKQLQTRGSITELRLRNDTNQKLLKETVRDKEEKWAQLKARTKEKSFNIRKSRAKEVNGSLPKHSADLHKGKIQSQLMKTQLIPGKFKQRLLQSAVKTSSMFYRPSSQK